MVLYPFPRLGRKYVGTVTRVRVLEYVFLHPRRVLTLIAAALASLLYVWVAAVRAVPAVRARKADMRARRRLARDAGRRPARG
jgi:hypothetical protein